MVNKLSSDYYFCRIHHRCLASNILNQFFAQAYEMYHLLSFKLILRLIKSPNKAVIFIKWVLWALKYLPLIIFAPEN